MKAYYHIIEKAGEDSEDCLTLPISKAAGYLHCYHNGKWLQGHRIAYRKYVGRIPKGMHVCHHCDNKECINPKHLFLGMDADNLIDMAKKGRGARKISNEDVQTLRDLYEEGYTQRYLATKYDLNITTVARIVRGERRQYIE